jgi:hypothetical protein
MTRIRGGAVALILAPQDGRGQDAGTLTVGIRPSLDLTFAPVTSTSDGGQAWTTLAPASSLANVPDSLAAASDGHLLMLSDSQQVSQYLAPASGWTALTSRKSLTASAPGRACARADMLAGPHASWRALPQLPPAHSDTLALPAAGEIEALAATGSALSVWQLDPATGRWRTQQKMNVPIEYGSSSS